MGFLLLITRFLETKRKWILITMEIVAFLLLWFDRLAYVYAGDISSKGYLMVRISNFMVFFLTPCVVFSFNLYIANLLESAKGKKIRSKRLFGVGIASAFGMLMAIIAAATDLYYYFDETNRYHRGQGFLIAYIIPIICPIIQFAVIRKYREYFSRLIYISLVLYIFVPIFFAILQIFAYGISLVNMSMVLVSVCLYVFTYMDINDEVEHAHEIEIQNMQGQQQRMKRVFDQTAKAFVSAVEKKDDFTEGNAVKVAEYARKVAELVGKNEEECEQIYYTALLHDVGLIGIPDSVIKNEEDPGKWDYEVIRQKPVIGKEILSNITEYPYLSIGAGSSHERYNGTGYPDGLKGEEIPEIARIVAVADAYVTMTSKKRYRAERPAFVAREAFIKGAGAEFDPVFANAMVKIIDEESRGKSHDDISIVERELSCREYRDRITIGIPVFGNITNISFNCMLDENERFSSPSIVLFDSYDRRIHSDEKTIRAYRYEEYGEMWFDGHANSSASRKIVLWPPTELPGAPVRTGTYFITAAKYDDHVKLILRNPDYEKEIIMSLQDGSTSVYIGITGEYCKISDIRIDQTAETIDADYIPRISDEVSYIAHMESDIRNIQISQTRSVSTEGIELTNKLRINFHSTSLPVASFVWHCAYIVIFSSEDGTVEGADYHEYALIKINGENELEDHYADNNFSMKKTENFPGWDSWKEKCREGIECEVSFERRGNTIYTVTDNLGVHIENTTVIKEKVSRVYVALTGDRVALTDIRIR